MTRSLFVLILWSATSVVQAAASQGKARDDCEAAIAFGKLALDREQLDVAAERFARASAICLPSGKSDEIIDYKFYSALTQQLQALAAKESDPTRSAKLTRARDLYLEVIKAQPDRGAALLNLAEVYAELGKSTEARAMFERSLAAGGAKSPWYLASYGRFLVRIGDLSTAATYIKAAITADPQLLSAQTANFELITARDGEAAAVAFLCTLRKERGPIAGRIASGAIADSSLSDDCKLSLVQLIVETLTEQSYLPSAFAGSDIGRDLAGRLADPIVGEAIRELFALHSGAETKTSFSWWLTTSVRSGCTGSSAAELFNALAVSLGDRLKRSGDFAGSERYYRLALVQGDRVNLLALTRLEELYTMTRDLRALDSTAQRYEPFVGTDQRLPRSAASLHDLHNYYRELGTLYATFLTSTSVQRNGVPDVTVSRAVVENFKKAESLSDEYNRHQQDPANRLQLDGQSFLFQAAAYDEMGSAQATAHAQLNAAADFASRGSFDRAAKVLALLEPKEGMLDGTDQQRLLGLRKAVAAAHK
jgi:tetratricopeptide (TPR) repeat protein